ncbi:MAG: hypothetical protein RIG62_26535 [Cyclobacteriaceae bacterium]
MNNLGIMLLGLITCSCALLDGYKDNRHSVYEDALTDEHRKQLEKGDTITINFYADNNISYKYGDLLVIMDERKKRNYRFIEIGDWIEEPQTGIDLYKNDIIKRQTTYDRYGNVVHKKTYVSPSKSKELFQYDCWDSEINSVDNDSVLIQHIRTYYTNGQVSKEYQLAIPQYDTLVNDYFKTKYKVGKEYRYDQKGVVTDSFKYDYSEKIVSKRVW